MSILLPNKLRDVQSLLHALDWRDMGAEVAQEAQSRVVILGPVNSGKSTLFNRLHGSKLSAVSAVPGTTTGAVEHPLGPLMLVDTPGFGEVWGVDRAEAANAAAAKADLIILLLDASAGVRQSDHDLFQDVKRFKVPVVLALNKADLIKEDKLWVLANIEKLLGVRPIPISANTGMGISDELLPAILTAQPGVAVAMARALPGARKQLINRIIRRTAWLNAGISLEPFPGLDIPLLLASQTRMVLRIAAAYGQNMTVSHARELLTTMAGSLLARYLGLSLAKFVPGAGWLVSAVFSAIGTFAIGHAAQRYFEVGGQIKSPDLKTLYKRLRKVAPKQLFRRRQRKGNPIELNTDVPPLDTDHA